MSTSIQDALRPGELVELRRDFVRLTRRWAATLLGVEAKDLWMHPDRDVLAAQLTATELALAELNALSRQLEREGRDAGMSQPELARARGVSAQAVSQRLAVKAG